MFFCSFFSLVIVAIFLSSSLAISFRATVIEEISSVPEKKLFWEIGMGSNISPLDIFLAAFPIKNNGLVINLDVIITAGIITINIIIPFFIKSWGRE